MKKTLPSLTAYSPPFIHQLGGLRGTEWIIIAVIIVFVLFGSKKLPELAKSIGRATGEFEKGKLEVAKEIRAIQAAPSQPTISTKSDQEKLLKAARELGIATEGKTETQLREEISKMIIESSPVASDADKVKT